MIMNSILDTLNKEQRAAAEAIDGPVMVFAGAGTGKTKTLIARIINIIPTTYITACCHVMFLIPSNKNSINTPL